MENSTNKIKDTLTAQLNQVVTQSLSPLMLWLEPVVREVGDNTLTFEYTVKQVMTNPAGTLHGGIIAAIMDDIIGATTICMGRSTFYTTLNNVIDYFAAAKLGDTITAKTQVIKPGRQVINVQCELWNLEKNRMLARGYSNMLRTEVPVPKV